MRTGHTSPRSYEIRVQGRLERRWEASFDGFTVTPVHDGTTVIAGTVRDQAALHGLLQTLRDLGLPLVSVAQAQDELTTQPVGTGQPAPGPGRATATCTSAERGPRDRGPTSVPDQPPAGPRPSTS